MGAVHAIDSGHEHDIPKQQNMATWLGICAITFFYATFIASNVYLRGWSPSKFTLDTSKVGSLPYYSVLTLVLTFIVLLVAGGLFRSKKWRALNAVMAFIGLLFVAYVIMQFQLVVMYGQLSAQVWTAYMPSGVMQLLLALLSLVFVGWVGWRSTFRSKTAFRRLFPIGMNYWMYCVLTSVVTYLLTDVMSVGSIAQWCGAHLGLY